MPKNDLNFSKKLISWYLQNKRPLPWRATKDPYHIWLSEIILQQTRVAQGLPYYLSFIDAFPNVHELAMASEEQVLKLWQGLGYYTRARNLHATARYVSNENDGIFPTSYKSLLKLKGVGDYTASAIASICYEEPTAVVDGNVYRVLSRVFGIDTPINSTQGIKEFKALAQQLIDPSEAGDHNQAIMEFGARQCVPQNPVCLECIFNTSCQAFLAKRVSELPVKLKKSKVKNVFYNYLVFLSEEEETMLSQRKEKGIWRNLYQFPLVESEELLQLSELKKTTVYNDRIRGLKVDAITKYNDTPILHKLSHRNIYTTFWIANATSLGDEGVSLSQIHRYPVPVLIENFLHEFSPMKNSKI